MKDKKPSKKQRIKKFIAISSIVISLVLSSIALYNTNELDELKSGKDGDTTLTRIGGLYGTHGCEEGGFSVQFGIDDDGDALLGDEEVLDIKNICHGKQGESGPMGNRGYWGQNGTDGYNGINGTNGEDGLIGQSSFIDSYTGPYEVCPKAAIIEMGNNSTSQHIDSSIKICFQDLFSGRLTDIHPNSGDSFTTACNGGFANDELFIFAAVLNGNCLLFKLDQGQVVQISSTIDFSPGFNLGFIEHENRIWFDASDGANTQLWSTDGDSTWKETNLSSSITSSDKMIKVGEELVLSYQNGMAIFSQSETWISGTFSNITSTNEVLIFNTDSGISIDGNIMNGEIHSDAIYYEEYYWFMASSDGNGVQLHRGDSSGIERMTSSLLGVSAQLISPTIIGGNIVFDSDGLYSFDPDLSTLTELNSSLQNVGQSTGGVIHDGKLWFDCGVPSFGYELCVSDGENAWLHSDHIPGMDSSNPSNLAVIGDKLVAIIDDPLEGGQLHQITENGLELIWDHASGNLGLGVHDGFWYDDEMIYFIGDSTTLGLEIYGWSHGELSGEWIIIH